jgi:hypothetical protein
MTWRELAQVIEAVGWADCDVIVLVSADPREVIVYLDHASLAASHPVPPRRARAVPEPTRCTPPHE